jgi:hypothetical protein
MITINTVYSFYSRIFKYISKGCDITCSTMNTSPHMEKDFSAVRVLWKKKTNNNKIQVLKMQCGFVGSSLL